jgi:hypothetical protein
MLQAEAARFDLCELFDQPACVTAEGGVCVEKATGFFGATWRWLGDVPAKLSTTVFQHRLTNPAVRSLHTAWATEVSFLLLV